MQPLVSILIPAYNSEQWITETIRSALAQTWQNKELVIVDDGSSDRTLEIAKRFASANVQVITQENQGAAAARNTAYSICQGEYLQWLDADDLLEPDKVEKQMAQLRDGATRRTLLSGAWAYFMYRKNKAQFSPSPLWQDLTPLEWLVRKMGNNLHMQTDNWLVSRELSEAAGPWDVRLWRDNDGEYFCRVVLKSDGIRFVPDARSYYRMAGFKSVSYIGGSRKKLESLFLSMQLHIRYLLSLEDSERTRSVCITYIRNWLHEFYPYSLDLAQKLKSVAADLGEKVEDPKLPSRYDWIVRLFGWNVGRKAQIVMPKLKHSLLIAWDRALFEFENRSNHNPKDA